jgi:tetratricopeptide (TPR) repeat protein
MSDIMSNKLIEQLENFAREEPNDPFNHYALALEYLKVDVHKAQTLFEQLIGQHQHYVPTYYHLGQLLAGQGKTEQAIQIFERGIVAARNAGDQKALREMEGARLAILYDN